MGRERDGRDDRHGREHEDRDRDLRGREGEEDRVAQSEVLLHQTALLASATGFRLGNSQAGRGLVLFVNGDLKATIQRRWSEWQHTFSVDPSPWKIQVCRELVSWLASTVASGLSSGVAQGLPLTITLQALLVAK